MCRKQRNSNENEEDPYYIGRQIKYNLNENWNQGFSNLYIKGDAKKQGILNLIFILNVYL